MEIVKLELTDKPVPSGGPYAAKFDHFNLVQSTLIRNGVPDDDANLVLGTATSTGKTISAEFFVHTTLAKKKMVIYAAPMRALATEKYEEWKERFPNHKVNIITGDFKENNKNEAIVNSDIIILTNEMLDVKTRGLKDEDHWLRRVGLLVVDEAHIMGSEQRGSAAEAGIIRLTNFVKDARIVLLSATVPNSQDFVKWLAQLNGKKTYSLNTSWRPVPLEWKFAQIENPKFYAKRIENTIKQAVAIVKKCLPEKCLCFVHEKKTGETLLQTLKKAGIQAEFHSADKSAAVRRKMESQFADRSDSSMKVLISTSTLAWGVSLPARNVVICGTQRGLSEVEVADIIQMAGRSGRLGIDPEGTCWLLADDVMKWRNKVANQAPVRSQMGDMDALTFQVLAEVYLRVIKNIDELKTWYTRSLTSIQEKDAQSKFIKSVQLLKDAGMIVSNDENELFVTPIGKLATRSYFRPTDVHYWRTYLKALNDGNHAMDDFAMALLIGMTPSVGLEYVPKQFQGNVDGFLRKARTAKVPMIGTGVSFFVATCVYEQLKGEANAKGMAFHIKNLIADAERITGTINQIVELDELEINTTSLLPRFKHGIPEQLVPLCEIPNVGAKRALLLWQNKVRSRDDLLAMGREKIGKIVGAGISKKIFEAIA